MKIHLKKKLLACLISALSLSTNVPNISATLTENTSNLKQDIPNARAKLKFYNPVRLLNNYIFYKHKVAERGKCKAENEQEGINDLFYNIKDFCEKLECKAKYNQTDLEEYSELCAELASQLDEINKDREETNMYSILYKNITKKRYKLDCYGHIRNIENKKESEKYEFKDEDEKVYNIIEIYNNIDFDKLDEWLEYVANDIHGRIYSAWNNPNHLKSF